MNIVITGASRGVGFYSALQLAKNSKHKIFALSRNEEGLKKLKSSDGSSSGIEIITCDITSEESISRTIQIISKSVSGIDILINNAGILVNKLFSDLTMEDWKSIYETNVFGMVNITKALIPFLKEGSISPDINVKSHVVNISSMGGIQGSMKFKGLSAYTSSKAALIAISECLSEELIGTGIRFNTIALGSVETEMFQTAFPGIKAASEPIDTAIWLADFALTGHRFFNGKLIPLSTSTP